ncbi:hypothetical protein POM88_015437 [Heracleum sosnowskyi]|uniref:F-box associated beta-propeller type 3 domain-containing protein n=1 Tax=Heracleum sosnowskyi TaxID=360622 RepID=A0AAD8MW71_9APIA|nr:hypothetical protein POM88_015437 [Heracleum sosnowskyi]
MILSTVVDSHNLECDEEEEERRKEERETRRRIERDYNLYVEKLIHSNRLLWRDGRRQEHKLEKSYVSNKEKDRKWKHIDSVECNEPVNFQSGGMMANLPTITEIADTEKPKAMWTDLYLNMKQMPHNTRGGISFQDAEFINMSYIDPRALVDEIGERLTAEHLNKLQAVEIVLDCHDGAKEKEKLLYFMKDGCVKKMSIQELLIKSTKELKYVHYFLKKKNKVCKEWSGIILATIRQRFQDGGKKYDGKYTPVYLNLRDQEVEMQRGGIVKEISWEKVIDTASHLGYKPPPLIEKRKAEKMVFQRQKKQRENEEISIPATQEPSSQCEDAGNEDLAAKELPDNAPEAPNIEMDSLIENIAFEGSPQEPSTQRDEEASEPQTTQEPSVANTDASHALDENHQNASVKSLAADKLKGISIPDDSAHNHAPKNESEDSSSESDNDDADGVDKTELARAMKASLEDTYGSSSQFMVGSSTVHKANTGKASADDNVAHVWKHEWDNEWYRPEASISFNNAHHHASHVVSLFGEQSLAFDPLVSPYYKVVCFKEGRHRVYLIFSSETGQWKNIIFADDKYWPEEDARGVYWNGAVYWISYHRRSNYRFPCFRFDVIAENFRQVKMPNSFVFPENYNDLPIWYFGEFSGHLHFICVPDLAVKKFKVSKCNPIRLNRYTKYWVNIDHLRFALNLFIKHSDKTNHLITPFLEEVAKGTHNKPKFSFSILTVLGGQKDEDSALIISIAGKVFSYNFKKVKVLPELPYEDTTKDFEYASAYPFVANLYPL